MKKIDHLPVNWVNGLKLNNGHFFETYYNMVDTVRHSREGSLASYDYGFGENPSGTDFPVELEATGDTIDTACIRLKSCNAVTRNGYTILYDRELYGEYVPTVKVKDSDVVTDKEKDNGDATRKGKAFYVILSVNPYKLLPVGFPDPEVTPLHHPYALPEISLQLMPVAQVNKEYMEHNCIIAGKGVMEGGTVVIDKDYIPPVQRVCHDGRLMSFLDIFRKHVQSLYNYSLAVCRKNVRDSRRDRLMDNTFTLCNAVQRFYVMHIFDLKHLAPEQPPVHLVRLANEFAVSLQTVLRTMPEKETEYLLQYYQEWTNVSPADFQQALDEVENIGYRHTDMRPSLQSVDSLMKTLAKVFKKMGELEYVGLMRENIILSEDSDGSASEERQTKHMWD